jgi:hypothetical protein
MDSQVVNTRLVEHDNEGLDDDRRDKAKMEKQNRIRRRMKRK